MLVLDLHKVLPYGGKFIPGAATFTAEEIIALCIYRGGPGAVVEARVRGSLVTPTGNVLDRVGDAGK